MRAEEIQHGAEHGRIANPGSQGIGREPGEREQPFGPALALQQPAEGAERQGLRIGGGLVGG